MMKIKNIVLMGLAIAILVVMGKFLSFTFPIMGFPSIKIGFGLSLIFLVAIKMSPIKAATVAALADVIHATLFPIGPFFPGFTLTSFLSGLMIGYSFIWLNKIFAKNNYFSASFIACSISILVTEIFITLLNTLWLNILYSTPISILIIPRIFAAIIRTFLIVPISYFLYKFSKNLDI